MPVWPVILAAVVALIAGLIILPLRQMRKIKKRVRREFAKPPKKTYGLGDGERYLGSLAEHVPVANTVDDLTWGDLDGDEVFGRLNGCQSTVGDVMLYCTLRRPDVDEAWAANRGALMELAGRDAPLREKLQYRMARLGRYGSGGLEMAAFHAGAMKLHRQWLFVLLAVLPLLSLLLFFVNLTLAIIVLAGSLLLNLVLCNIIKSRNEISFSSVRYVASALACASYLNDLLKKDCPAHVKALRQAASSLSALRVSVFILSINHIAEESIGFDPFTIFLLPLLAYGSIVSKLAKKGEQVQALYAAVGEVDVCCAVAGLRQSVPGWCPPQYTQAPRLSCQGLYHPLISQPVTNGATFERDVLFTGSNASGKSTFIKAVALSCLCGQSIQTCFAQAFEMKRGRVATSMAVADSVVDGDSYFVAEIKSMRRLVRMADDADAGFCYFFIDEILKGTNTVERIAASCAVLRRLYGAPCICFAATHDIELTVMLEALYDNRHFRETVTKQGVTFDYQLHSGPAKTRNAILLLDRMGFPSQLTGEANLLVEHFEETGEWLEAQA